MDKTLATVAVLAILAMPWAAPSAAQDGQTVEMTITAMETGCGDTTYCWEVEANGAFQPGDTLEITVVNPGSNTQQHNLYIMDGTPEQEGGGSEADDASWNTEMISPGEEASLTVEVPEDTEALYFWCEVGGHENLGMYGTLSAGQDGGDGTGTGGDGQSSSPGLGLVAALAGLALAAFVAARRR